MSAVADLRRPTGRPRRPLRPFTVEHFRQYCSRLRFDDGEYRDPEPWQLDFARDVFRGYRRSGSAVGPAKGGAHDIECLLLVPEGNGKALALDTPLATPSGWTTMGDVRAGDEVLGSGGLPTRVAARGPVLLGRRCYRVTFSDGASVVADGDHLWTVQSMGDLYRERTMTTEQLLDAGLETRRGARRWRVPTAARQAPDAELPVDPYVLGAWLGDGCAGSGRIVSMDEHVWDRVRAAGYALGRDSGGAGRAQVRTALGLLPALRAAGVLHRKHVPEAYLTASPAQRLALLQGLMDTDGHVSAAGQATFTTTSDALADGVRRLAWSLGRPCYRQEKRVALSYGDRREYASTNLVIACGARHEVASLPRKAERLKSAAPAADHRRVASIERVPSVPVRCIAVDAPDSLYLAGEALVPTHNTTFVGQLALYGCDWSDRPWIPVGASTRDQAMTLYAQIRLFVNETPGLALRFRCYDGNRAVRPLVSPAHVGAGFYPASMLGKKRPGNGIEICPWSPASNDGAIPYPYFICDELHRHEDMGLWRLWKGKCKKRGAQGVGISTAGEPGTEFEELRDRTRERAVTRRRRYGGTHYRGGRAVMYEFMVESPELIESPYVNGEIDEAAVARTARVLASANPLSTNTAETFADDLASPSVDMGDVKRLKGNVPARSTAAAITDGEWAGARAAEHESVPPGERVDVGYDVAWKYDTTAVVPCWRAPESDGWPHGYLLLDEALVETPPRDGTSMHPDRVKRRFYELLERNPIDAVVMDMGDAEDVAAWLSDELGLFVVDRQQSNDLHVLDYKNFMRGLRNCQPSAYPLAKARPDEARHRLPLRHVRRCPMLTRHSMNAVGRRLPRGDVRFDRPSESRTSQKRQEVRVVDALTAAGMVVTHAVATQPAAQVPMVAMVGRR